MRRKEMTIEEIREDVDVDFMVEMGILTEEEAKTAGICRLVDVENMGFVGDSDTRWYHFTNSKGEACVYYKY